VIGQINVTSDGYLWEVPVYVTKYAVTTQLLELKLCREFEIDTSDVLTIVVSRFDKNKLMQTLFFLLA